MTKTTPMAPYLSLKLNMDIVPSVIHQLRKSRETRSIAESLLTAYDAFHEDTFDLRKLSDKTLIFSGSFVECKEELIKLLDDHETATEAGYEICHSPTQDRTQARS